MIEFLQVTGFEWDKGDESKSFDKHSVSQAEAERVFFNEPLLVLADVRHSGTEPRFRALGKSFQDRCLHITFTLRKNSTLIRIISARDMHRNERKIYDRSP